MSSKLKFPNMIPLKLVVNIEPELELGIVYKINSKENKKRIYKIKIDKLFLLRDSTKITDILYQKHSEFLNNKIIPKNKFKTIVEKMLNEIFKELDNYNEDDHSEELDYNYNDEDDNKNDFLKQIENLKNQKTDNINLDRYKKKSYEI